MINKIDKGLSNVKNGGRHSEKEKEKMLPGDKFEEELDDFYKDMDLTEDTKCGIGIFQGSLLQNFANKKTFVLIYGLAGMCFSSTYAYFSGTITTMEKRFRIPSKTTGIISIGNDITQLLSAVLLSYYAGRGHRPRWIALGLYCVSAFCFLNALPHLIYGPGEDALQLTIEYGDDYSNNSTYNETGVPSKHLCGSEGNDECELGEGSIVPSVIWFIAQLISGIGGTLFYSLGFSYMDDNIKKSKSPALISFTYFIRTMGPTVGYAMVSIFLKMYIAPDLTPTIDNTDPRWIGAWWVGWFILGFLIMFLATLLALLPKTLPRAAARKELVRQKSKESKKDEASSKPSFADMMVTVKRLMKNSTYNYNQLASVFYIFGYVPFWVFLPKYIETQYRKSASVSSLVTGTVGLVFSAVGVLVSGIIVQRYKPRARYMAAWNVIVGLITVAGVIGYSFLGCSAVDEQLPMVENGNLNNSLTCNENCKCDYVKFSPVCSIGHAETFISACHAGCTQQYVIDKRKKLYTNCSCIEPYNQTIPSEFLEEPTSSELPSFIGGSATSGPCIVDCQNHFYLFLAIVCFLKLFGAMGRVTNFLVSVRCVEERDKTVSLGISMMASSLFALIPSPIFFGYIMDSTCLVWGKTCTQTGNCWLYNSALLRTRLNYISAAFILIGSIFDIAVWKDVKDLNMFDDELEMLQKQEQSDTQGVSSDEKSSSKEDGENDMKIIP